MNFVVQRFNRFLLSRVKFTGQIYNAASYLSFFQSHKGRFTYSMPCPCRVRAVPLPCRAAKGLEYFSHLIYTVRLCLIHTCHAMPCSDHVVLLKATAQHGRAVLCCGLEKNGVVGAWHGKCESNTAALCKSNGKDTL